MNEKQIEALEAYIQAVISYTVNEVLGMDDLHSYTQLESSIRKWEKVYLSNARERLIDAFLGIPTEKKGEKE